MWHHFSCCFDFWICYRYLLEIHGESGSHCLSLIPCFDGRSIMNLTLMHQLVQMDCRDFLCLWNLHGSGYCHTFRSDWRVLNHLSKVWPMIFPQLHCWSILFVKFFDFRVFLEKFVCSFQNNGDPHAFLSIFVFWDQNHKSSYFPYHSHHFFIRISCIFHWKIDSGSYRYLYCGWYSLINFLFYEILKFFELIWKYQN